MEIAAQRSHDRCGDRQPARLEEFRVAHGDGGGFQINVLHLQTDDFPKPKPGTIGEHDHGVQRNRPQGRSRRWEGTRSLEQLRDLVWRIDVRPPLPSLDSTTQTPRRFRRLDRYAVALKGFSNNT